ncbi:MAG: hypothetical protein KAH84_08815 [Thiomargarita sp.]|nr:hypothetical protein [Thiomargarita sp.]
MKKYLFTLVALVIIASCATNSIKEPPSNLQPDKIKEFTENRKIATRMFSAILTQIENGMVSYTIHRQTENAPLYLIPNTTEQTVHKLCKKQKSCIGGVFASVHNNNSNKGEILYRVYKTQQMQLDCSWLEIYDSSFALAMNEELKTNIIGRAWHWTKNCFATTEK